MGKAIMVQGTGSSVGKSVIATALCRIFHQDGWRVAPFKAQNMSLNSYVTPDGREIGRAQGVQAEAAGIEAEAVMNPILLKPSADCIAQVVLLGRPVGHLGAREYRDAYLPTVLPTVKEALADLLQRFDIVVIEGAGSPAEINLKERDIANMPTAALANAPVLLVGDVDRGGLFAAYIGTLELLEPAERERVAGFIVNKFRGDLGLLQPGLAFLEERTGKPVLGVIPFLPEHLVEEEDSVALAERPAGQEKTGAVSIAVVQLPHIANFTDFDPLEEEEGVHLRYVRAGESIGAPDAVILPGSKSTVADLRYLREAGYEREIQALAARGVPVVGICGGYQMLGQWILDPKGVESAEPETHGLGLLNVVTEFAEEKRVVRVRGTVTAEAGFLSAIQGEQVEGYEIHMGVTRLLPGGRVWLQLEAATGPVGLTAGAMAADGRVLGTYLHDIFHNRNFRRAFVNHLRRRRGLAPLKGQGADPRRERAEKYDRLAALVRTHLNMGRIYQLLGLAPGRR